MKMKAYFLASQKTWHWQDAHVFQIVRSVPISERVAQYPVSKPDLTILRRCINAVSMNGSPPFQSKCTCFKNFPEMHIQRITLLTYTCDPAAAAEVINNKALGIGKAGRIPPVSWVPLTRPLYPVKGQKDSTLRFINRM